MSSLYSDEEFQEAFQLFDKKGDGKIQVKQIGNVIRVLGLNPTESDVKKFTNQYKPDERISMEVFLPIFTQISKVKPKEGCTTDAFIEMFRNFDKDGNGFISAAELRHLLTGLGEKMTEREVEQLISGYEDSLGNVRYEDFVHMVMEG